MLSALRRYFDRTSEPDSRSTDPATHATDPSPGQLDAGSHDDRTNRRNRSLAPPETHLTDVVAQKVLNAWLQNRHQTLVPLSVNLRNLESEKALVLVGFMAIATLAGGADVPSRQVAAEQWLQSVGADERVLAEYRRAIADPEPLSHAINAVQDSGLAALAYIMALVAVRRREPAEERFVDYLGARLGLGSNVIRSADRRYRS